MTVAMIVRGFCRCGRYFIVFQPEKRDLAEKVSLASGDRMDIYICDQPEAFCSQCGQAITLLIPEELDTDRHSLGLLLEKLERETDRKPGEYSIEELEELESLFGELDHEE